MSNKTYLITLKWSVNSTKLSGVFQEGTSRLQTKAKNKTEAINAAIDFASHIPSFEFERNEIDIQSSTFMDGCRGYYYTKIEKIVDVQVVEDKGE